MDSITILGVAAGILTTVSFLPQVIRTWRTRHTKDISLYMFALLAIGIALWLVYGYIRNDLPLVLANAVSFLFVVIILVFKIRHG
ncbi:MAG: SemiSWEET transporter [Deltaproteobacteria bacterium]|nr:SemiSWEET transporter [Deltaproteobacteria bacterium]